MQEMPVFWPGEFQGQRSLAGYSPRGHKESDVTEQLSLSVRKLLRGLVIPQGGMAREGDSQQWGQAPVSSQLHPALNSWYNFLPSRLRTPSMAPSFLILKALDTFHVLESLNVFSKSLLQFSFGFSVPEEVTLWRLLTRTDGKTDGPSAWQMATLLSPCPRRPQPSFPIPSPRTQGTILNFLRAASPYT